MLLLKADENLSERGQHRPLGVFSADDPTGHLLAAWQVKEQPRALLKTRSIQNSNAAKNVLADLVARTGTPETNTLYRTVRRWSAEIEVLIFTGATTEKVEANNTAVKHIDRTARGCRIQDNYKSLVPLRSTTRTAT